MMNTKFKLLKHFCERRSLQVFALRLTALCVCVLLCAVYNSAQTRGGDRRTKPKTNQTKPKTLLKNNSVTQKDEVIETNNAVRLVNQVQADYLTGEASVSVNPKQPTVVRLGLAQNATALVEFPLVDQIYYIHEGNPKLVTVFQSPTKETDRVITLYPGEGFLPAAAPGQKELSVTITMQMKSGLVIVLEIVPAPGIGQNAHRCVLNYNIAEVIAARRAAGLKVNLGDETPVEQKTQTRAVSTFVGNNQTINADLTSVNSANSSVSVVEITSGGVINESDKRKRKTCAELSRLVNKKLAEAIKTSKEKFTIWSPAVEGLSLSTAKIIEIDPLQRLLIIAVKNEAGEPLRLLEEMPELNIQTVDKTGNSLQIERLTKKYTETTALQGAIPAGATVYYAVVYENPVLGANQKLLVSVAHDRAADTPVVAGAVNKTDK
jgi:hypothetical protein